MKQYVIVTEEEGYNPEVQAEYDSFEEAVQHEKDILRDVNNTPSWRTFIYRRVAEVKIELTPSVAVVYDNAE